MERIGDTVPFRGHPPGNPKAVAGSRRTGGEPENHEAGNVEPTKKPRVKGKILMPGWFNNFCKLVNGYVKGEEEEKKYLSKHNFFSLRDMAKAVWIIYPALQLVGLVSDRVEKLARAWYGVCWSIVYSCYRPWKENREQLAEKKDDKGKPVPIKDWVKGIYNANEYFRAIMGTIVSAIYGSGAFGMLYAWFKGDDSLFDKAAEVYKTGMLNQNQIFASMNAAIVMQRVCNSDQLYEVDKPKTGVKAMTEYIDTVLFIPNIVARGLATFEMFGLKLGEGLKRFINALGYFSYGTWAARFGIMKSTSDKEGGDLLKDLKDQSPMLYSTQEVGGRVFHTLLPAISWVAAIAELLGFRELAEKAFTLEGKCERLLPAIPAWCLANPWLIGYLRKMKLGRRIEPSLAPM